MSFLSNLFGWKKKNAAPVEQAVEEEEVVARLSDLEPFRANPAFFDALITFPGGELKHFLENGDESYLACFEGATLVRLAEYQNGLIANGYRQMEVRRVLDSENLFAMYVNDTHVITTFFIAHKAQVRVIIEPKEKNGYYRYSNTVGEKVCEPLFLQVGCGPDGSKLTAGMCYIFRLSDGQFLIWDGGHDDDLYPAGENGKRLYQKLKEYAPDPEHIRIAAWLITHPHVDHLGPLKYFIRYYLDDPTIVVENLLVNNPSAAVLAEDHRMTEAKMQEFRDAIARLAAAHGTNVHKTHPGQMMAFGSEATVEIIHNHELRMPSALHGSNNLSIVARLVICGQTFMMTGDSKIQSNRLMEKMYESRLHCDFYQTPHHGMGANTLTLAEAVDPRWVLWPVGEGRVQISREKPWNAYLIGNDNHVEGIYLGKYLTHEFKLPFDGTNYTVTENQPIQ